MSVVRGIQVISLYGFGKGLDGTWTASQENLDRLNKCGIGQEVKVELRKVVNKSMEVRAPVNPETGVPYRLIPVTDELVEETAKFLAATYWRGTLKAKGFDDSSGNKVTAAMIMAASEARHEEWKPAAEMLLKVLAPEAK